MEGHLFVCPLGHFCPRGAARARNSRSHTERGAKLLAFLWPKDGQLVVVVVGSVCLVVARRREVKVEKLLQWSQRRLCAPDDALSGGAPKLHAGRHLSSGV